MRRSPLLHFLLAGGVLFLAVRILAPDPDPGDRILLVPHSRAAAGDVEAWLTEEILVREALALGLDADPVVDRRLARNLAFADAQTTSARARARLRQSLLHEDPVVRRRLAHLLRARLEATIDPQPPSSAEIRAWLELHPDAFAFPGTIRFEQVFFDPSQRRDAAAAAAALAGHLRTAPTAGEPIDPAGDPLPAQGSGLRTPDGVARYYGPVFAEALMAVPLGEWHGPLRSSLGFHVVRVTARDAPRPATFDEARSRVVAEILDERREAAFARGLERLRQSYEIRR